MDIFKIIIVSSLTTAFLAVPLINALYKLQMYKTLKGRESYKTKRNSLYYKFYKKKFGTPEGFGLILFVLLALIGVYINNTHSWALVMGAMLLGTIGLVDDYRNFKFIPKDGFWGLRARTKLLFQFLFLYLTYHLLFFDFKFLYLATAVLIALFIVNSANITDGLDGLLGGLTLAIFSTLLLTHAEGLNLWDLYLLTLMIGFLIIFLYFNTNPARVFLGEAGSMIIGFLLAYFLIKTGWRSIILYFLIIIEGISSILQITSLKILKKKLFKIAPLHLLFLNKGWGESKIVSRAWVMQFTLVILYLALIVYE